MPKARRNNGTPQAVDDLLVVEEIFSKSEFTDTGVTSLDLIQNDRGGKSKTFLGLGELGGESLVVDGVGEIEYDFEADSFSFKPAEGFEGGTVEFVYAIQMGNGVVSSATASFTADVERKVERTVTFDDVFSGRDFGFLRLEKGSEPNDIYGGLDWHDESLGDKSGFGIVSNEAVRTEFQSNDGLGRENLIDNAEDDILIGRWSTIQQQEGVQLGFSALEGETFDFIKADFASIYGNETEVIAIAHDKDGEKGRSTFVLSGQAQTVDFNSRELGDIFENISKVTFEAREKNGNVLSNEGAFAMDDLVIAQDSAVLA